MTDDIMLTIGEDGKASLYDDTYDITIHCKSQEEQDEVKRVLQNVPHWIPVTEDTPTEDDDYWATFDAETGRFVDWASWYHGRWVTWIEGSPAPLSNVIAWQKSPEPYKGVTT